MSQFVNQFALGVGCFAASCCFNFQQAQAQNPQSPQRQMEMVQNASDIASLPRAQVENQYQSQTEQVRAGFAPQQAADAQTGYRGSFYQQGSNQQTNSSNDVYPYPSQDQPRQTATSQSAYALSQGDSSGRLSNQISIGSNTATGNLRGDRFASNTSFDNNLRVAQAQTQTQGQAQTPAQSQAQVPVNQQTSSTLNPAEQARINQAAVDRFRAQRAQYLAQQNQAAQGQAPRVAANPNAYRQTAYQANPRLAQNCNCVPNYNPTAAGYQAAFQAPAINPNVGQGLGLGLGTPPANFQQGGFNQACQSCVPAYQGYQGAAYQGGYQQQGGYQYGGIGTPQFGAQGARWWTPFFTGSGVYTPLIRLVQNNAGTYLGQGIIGQPTAYVNGQPLRNLLRYIAP